MVAQVKKKKVAMIELKGDGLPDLQKKVDMGSAKGTLLTEDVGGCYNNYLPLSVVPLMDKGVG